MRVIVWLLVIAFAVTVAGCKQPPQMAAATSAPTTTAAAPKPPAAPPKAPAPARRAAGYEELTLAVSIPAHSEAAGQGSPGPGGHSGCPMSASSGILGIQISQPHGVIVGAVVPGGPADKAGIKVGDSIIACDGQPVTCPASLLPLLSGGGPRDLKLTVRRAKTAAAAAPPAAHAGA